MADVLIVCVREDEPQAKALAEMFEAAGFSIGGAPANDAALRSSGAGVIVWSQASIRSRPFLDAAQRVINADKAVVASLIEPPPPSSIGSSAAFDLSHWEGDPNDPSLDPLFFAVDRMVNAARASVGAAVRQEEYPAPTPAPQPLPRTGRAPKAPTPQSSRPAAQSGDALSSEAEHWRSIRDSRDPADFMDYLARFGAGGAFAELAELRLSQLTSAAPPARAPSRPAAPGSARARVETPMSAPAVVRRPDALPPTPRRAEVPAPRRMPPPDRSYDRTDLRDPPRGEGKPLRAFVLIAMLGAIALASGLYFGGGIDLNGNRGTQVVEDVPPAPEPTTDDSEFAGDVGPDGVSLQDLAPERAGPVAPRREPTPPTRTASNTTNPPAGGVGGPISLVPGAEPGTQPTPPRTSGPVSLDPNAATTSPGTQPQLASVSTNPPLEAATPPRAPATVSWAQRPSARRISDLYPSRALREGVGGRVQLDCIIQQSLAVACSVATETPSGLGFGSAALSAASSYRAQPRMSDGSTSVGARARIAIAFQAPQ